MVMVPTGRMETELRKLYVSWVRKLPDHEADLTEYLAKFQRESTDLVNRMGGDIARLGVSAGFPAPKELDLALRAGTIYSDMQVAAVRASITTGLNSRTAARQLFRAEVESSYKRLERLARTETVRAYWQNQRAEAADLGLVLVWASEDGPRTCDWCRERDGLVADDGCYDHPNGRCTLAPMLPSSVKYKGSVSADGSIYYDPEWESKYQPVKTTPVKTTPTQKSAVGNHPKVDALPRLDKTPDDLKGAYFGGRANPNWWISLDIDGPYNINCTRVAYAIEMRARGYRVTAAGVRESDNVSDAWITDNWLTKDGGKRSFRAENSAEELINSMLEAPEGSRFYVAGPWRNGGAHIWNAEKKGGRIIFHEGQTYCVDSGTATFTERSLRDLDFTRYKGTLDQARWMRVDDLVPVDTAIDRGWIEVDGMVAR